MIEKIMKAVKSSNKRRGRNITIGAVIGFLLSCTAVAGTDNYLWIKDDDGEIKFSTTNNKPELSENPYSENSWNTSTNTYTNNRTLSGNNSYGLKLELNSENFEFINNGLISGTGNDNGIDNNGKIGKLTNNGLISGSNYGIYNYNGKIGTLTNNGSISGSNYGIYITSSLNSEIKVLNNTGIIFGNKNTAITSDLVSGISISNGEIIELNNIGMIFGNSNKAKVAGINITNSSGKIGTLNNNGIILGKSNENIASGVDISNGEIKVLNNAGMIFGNSSSNNGYHKGSGVDITNGKIETLNNTGIISGNSCDLSDGIGISISSGTIKKLNNIGKIFGYSTKGYGYGISISSEKIEILNNTGVIYGKNSAINGDVTTVNNYGILVGNNSINPTNYGLIIQGGSVTSQETGGEQDILFDKDRKEVKRKMTIKNEIGSNSFSGDKENHILNALKNTYNVIGTNNKVTGSIINAYGTAVVFGTADNKLGTEGNNQLTLSGTIVNGGIDESNPDTKGLAISGSGNGDTLILQSGEIKYTDDSKGIQNTIVNGNIDMKDGADILTIGAGTIINGTLDGGTGSDILNFGVSSVARSNSAESEEIKIMHNISNFENINIGKNTNVTLYEKTIDSNGAIGNLEVTGVNKITIGKDGNLILRIDGTNNNSHALSNNSKGTIESEGGKLLLGLNGVSDDSIINIGMKLGDGLYGIENKEIIYSDKFTLDTTSVLHSVERKGDSSTEVIVRSKPDLPLSPDTPEDVNYEKLNKIYQSMRVVDGVKEFDVDSDEKLSIFLGYLNDIYAGNPYSYSSELSRKSVGMFRDIATENQFKPEQNKWLILGGLTHVDGGTKDTYYGKEYYTYDIGSSDIDADTKITGAYMLGEYGVSDTLTYGVVIGGNKLKSNLSNGSKVDGDALYMGAYAKKYVGNLKVTGGLGLQYGDYDADRFAAGKGITETRSYSDNYNDMTYDIYLNGRYSNPMGDNFFLEPYGTLSYTYVDQDGADEGNKVLAIETDSKSFDYTAAKVGVDLKKVIPHEKGKSTLSAGVSYTRFLNGADEENITGRFKGGSDFDILVAHKNEHSIGLNAKYTLELESGILFDVKGSYSVERDSHNRSGKNRNKGEWVVGTGLGYKF